MRGQHSGDGQSHWSSMYCLGNQLLCLHRIALWVSPSEHLNIPLTISEIESSGWWRDVIHMAAHVDDYGVQLVNKKIIRLSHSKANINLWSPSSYGSGRWKFRRWRLPLFLRELSGEKRMICSNKLLEDQRHRVNWQEINLLFISFCLIDISSGLRRT